jgi:hypothetical protein
MGKIVIVQYCPNCAAVWTLKEMKDQHCSACKYPNHKADEEEFDPDPLEDEDETL